MISLTSDGSALYKMLMISVLIHTDLPEPVAPAINKCGILAISVIMRLPAISLPTANVNGDFALRKSSPSNNSRKYTGLGSGFGTSIPTADFPGIGASIRTLGAAKLSLRSSVRLVILFTRTPCSGSTSKRVTVGPQVTGPIVTFTLKLRSVSCSLAAVSRSSLSLTLPGISFGTLSNSTGGNSYGLCCSSLCFAVIFSLPDAKASAISAAL